MHEANGLQERLAHEIAFEFEEGQALGRMFAVTVGHFWDLNNMKSFRDKHSRTTDEEWHDLLEIELSNGDRVPAALLVEIMDPDRTRWEPSTFYEASALDSSSSAQMVSGFAAGVLKVWNGLPQDFIRKLRSR